MVLGGTNDSLFGNQIWSCYGSSTIIIFFILADCIWTDVVLHII